MEVAGVVLGQAPCFSSSGGDTFNSRHSRSFPAMKVSCIKQTNNVKSVVASVGFDDKSHLQYYYNNEPMMVVKEKEIALKKKKEMKKKLKLLKGLSKNLSLFSDLGFGLNPDDQGLDHQVKGQMISEATEMLLGELEKLKAEEMESKRKKKEEKAKKKAVAKMMMMDSSESSCSSSSESDDDCEKVVDMKCQQQQQLKAVVTTPQDVTPSLSVGSDNKIEVCMGGKCKKSGAEMLLENFKKAVGEGGEVVSCSKCMGKCKDAPNVRVRSSSDGGPLCIGVGLEDVDSIVSNLFGGSRRCGSDMVPGLSGA